MPSLGAISKHAISAAPTEIIRFLSDICCQSAMSGTALAIERALASAIAGDSQTTDISLAIERALVSAIAGDSQTTDISLAVLRKIASQIDAGSSTSAIILLLLSILDPSIGSITTRREIDSTTKKYQIMQK